MWRCGAFWNTSSTLMRGSVAFSPLFFSSSACVMVRGSARPVAAVAPGRASRPAARIAPSYRGCRRPDDAPHRRHDRLSLLPSCPHRPARRRPRAAAGCQSLQSSDSLLGVITPYRLEIVQGNVITKEQAALVKPGMSQAQVRDVLGSPLLTDLFHVDRWDYVFTIRRQGAEPQGARDRRAVRGRPAEEHRDRRRPAERARIRRLDRHLQDLAQRADAWP